MSNNVHPILERTESLRQLFVVCGTGNFVNERIEIAKM